MRVLKRIHKHYIGYGAEAFKYSLDEYIRLYLDYRFQGKGINNYKGDIESREYIVMYYGLDTLPEPYASLVNDFIGQSKNISSPTINSGKDMTLMEQAQHNFEKITKLYSLAKEKGKIKPDMISALDNGFESIGDLIGVVYEPVNIINPDKLKKINYAPGNTTTIETPNESIKAKYVLVPLMDLIESNDPYSFKRNPDYPEFCQTRNYAQTKAEQNKVISFSKDFKPEHLINNSPDATTGPPIITKEGIVLGGNGRAMILKRIHHKKGFDEYSQLLERNLESFGFSPGCAAHMILARMIDIDYKKCAAYSNKLNQSTMQERDAVTLGIGYAKQISEQDYTTLAKIFENSEESTFSATLNNAVSQRQIISVLEKSGLITPQNRTQWISEGTGELSKQGRAILESVLIGYIMPDKALMEAAQNYTNKLVKSLPLLIQIHNMSGTWNIVPDIKTAIREEVKRRRAGATKADYLRQDDMFASGKSDIVPENVQLVWKALDGGVLQFRDFLKKYIRTANNEMSGGSMFGESKVKSIDVLRKHISNTGLGDNMSLMQQAQQQFEKITKLYSLAKEKGKIKSDMISALDNGFKSIGELIGVVYEPVVKTRTREWALIMSILDTHEFCMHKSNSSQRERKECRELNESRQKELLILTLTKPIKPIMDITDFSKIEETVYNILYARRPNTIISQLKKYRINQKLTDEMILDVTAIYMSGETSRNQPIFHRKVDALMKQKKKNIRLWNKMRAYLPTLGTTDNTLWDIAFKEKGDIVSRHGEEIIFSPTYEELIYWIYEYSDIKPKAETVPKPQEKKTETKTNNNKFPFPGDAIKKTEFDKWFETAERNYKAKDLSYSAFQELDEMFAPIGEDDQKAIVQYLFANAPDKLKKLVMYGKKAATTGWWEADNMSKNAPPTSDFDAGKDIPAEFQKHRRIKIVDYELKPDNENLWGIIGTSISTDVHRPPMNGAEFNDKGVVTTDSYRIAFIPGKVSKVKEAKIFKETNSYGREKIHPVYHPDGSFIDETFAPWESVIPNISTTIATANTQELLNQLYTYKYWFRWVYRIGNGYTAPVVINFDGNKRMSFNPDYMLDAVTFMAKLGVETIYFQVDMSKPEDAPTKPLILIGNKNATASDCKVPFHLIMPIRLDNEDYPDTLIYTRIGAEPGNVGLSDELSMNADPLQIALFDDQRTPGNISSLGDDIQPNDIQPIEELQPLQPITPIATTGGDQAASINNSEVPDPDYIPFDDPRHNVLPELATAQDISSQVFSSKPLKLGRTRILFDNMLDDANMLIYGPRGEGKTTFALQYINDLSKNGDVLYVMTEEGISTRLKERLRWNKINAKNISFLETRDFHILREYLDSGNYKFVVIDSHNKIEGATQKQIIELLDEYSNISFVIIARMDKEAKIYRGDSDWEYDVDTVVKLEKGNATTIKHRDGPSGKIMRVLPSKAWGQLNNSQLINSNVKSA